MLPAVPAIVGNYGEIAEALTDPVFSPDAIRTSAAVIFPGSHLPPPFRFPSMVFTGRAACYRGPSIPGMPLQGCPFFILFLSLFPGKCHYNCLHNSDDCHQQGPAVHKPCREGDVLRQTESYDGNDCYR